MAENFQSCIQNVSRSQKGIYPYYVLSIIRVLLAVIKLEETAQIKDKWLKFISFLVRMKVPPVILLSIGLGYKELDPVEVFTVAGQLAIALILKALKKL